MGRWTEDEVKYLKEHARDMTQQEIANELGRSRSSVNSYASRHNVSTEDNLWTDEDIAFLEKHYGEMNNKEIGNELDRTKNAIQHKSKRLRLTSSNHSYRKHNINHNFFNQLDNKVAYWLGAIWGDGWIIKHQYSYILGFGSKDKEWVKQLKEDLEATYPIQDRKDGTYRLQVTSEGIFRDLIDVGILPNKTYENETPKIPSNFIADFIRGLYDADGSLRVKGSRYGFSIGNTIATCNWVKNRLNEELDIGGGVYEKNSTVMNTFQAGGRLQVTKILKWLYKDQTRCLERKLKRARGYGINV